MNKSDGMFDYRSVLRHNFAYINQENMYNEKIVQLEKRIHVISNNFVKIISAASFVSVLTISALASGNMHFGIFLLIIFFALIFYLNNTFKNKELIENKIRNIKENLHDREIVERIKISKDLICGDCRCYELATGKKLSSLNNPRS